MGKVKNLLRFKNGFVHCAFCLNLFFQIFFSGTLFSQAIGDVKAGGPKFSDQCESEPEYTTIFDLQNFA